MAKGFFITGTDTGVGKTVVSGALIRAIKKLGQSACGFKPIETGCKNKGGILVPEDGLFLKGMSETDELIDDISPYRFEKPLAPMVASELEKVEIDPLWIERAFERLSEKYDALIVEGVGGLLVPIANDFYVADLAKMFGLPLVIVTSPALGTLNHTLLTVDYAARAGIKVAGIIVNFKKPFKGTEAEITNPQYLERLLQSPILGIMPHIKRISTKSLEKAALDNLNMEVIKNLLMPEPEPAEM